MRTTLAFVRASQCLSPKVNRSKNFFDRYGFCVFRGVLPKDLCEATIDDMWKLVIENNAGVDREQVDTWYRGWSSFGMPKNTPSHAIFRASFLRLRQHPSVVQCFASMLKTNDIVCNHDRCLMHRPTQDGGVTRKYWATRPNVHLDMNPAEFLGSEHEKEVGQRLSSLRYSQRKNRAFISENNDVHSGLGKVLQGMLNFRDLPSTVDGGGTIVIPGSHNSLLRWWKGNKDTIKQRRGPTQHVLGADMLDFAQRVCMRAGSLLIWDQRLTHGSTSNNSTEFRYGIPIRFCPTDQLLQHRARATDRSHVLQEIIVEEGFEDELSDLGRKVFRLVAQNKQIK